jgi:acetyl esterase
MTAVTPPSFTGEDLDPQILRFQTLMSEGFARFPPLGQVTLPEARRIAEQVRAPWAAGGPVMGQTRELEIAEGGLSVRLRCHDPHPGATAPALIYLHGGGWTLFSLDTHDRVMREYAGRTAMIVVGVDYALSPEAKFPQALEQIVMAVRWLRGHGAERGIDPDRLAIGGDSAGANLAVAACLQLRDEGQGDAIRAMVLNYGVFDGDLTTESHRRFGGPGHMLESEEMAGFWRNYLRDDADRTNPLACPLQADLRGLPAAFMAIAEQDVLTDENAAMAEKLRRSAVPVEAIVYPGTAHSFLEAVSIAAVSDRAFADASVWLTRVLG